MYLHQTEEIRRYLRTRSKIDFRSRYRNLVAGKIRSKISERNRPTDEDGGVCRPLLAGTADGLGQLQTYLSEDLLYDSACMILRRSSCFAILYWKKS
jgi:hypothetical protein